MEKPINKETGPQSVEEVAGQFTSNEISEDEVISYLRANPQDITEFCLQTYERYQKGDKTGIIKLSMIIEKLL